MHRTITTPSSPVGPRVSFAAAAFALIALVAGCGGESTEQASSTSGAQTTVASQEGASSTTMPAALTPPPPPAGTSVITLGDSLPPDVAVAVEDSLVNPGDVIEVTAQGSDDVSQIGLSDGLGRMQLFTRDPASNIWHVLYRVPVGTTKDRLALSVTALNDMNRWRRVWVFVKVRQAESSAIVEPEGCGGAEE